LATIFNTRRLRVRHFTSLDADAFFALQSDPVVMQYIRPPRTREESDQFFREKILAASPRDYKGYWAVEEAASGLVIGSFVIIPIPDDTEKTQMGYSFLTPYWGKGYATEVAKEGVNYFYNCTPLTELFGVTETPNVASQKVLLKAGFLPHHTKMDGEKELQVYILRRVASAGA